MFMYYLRFLFTSVFSYVGEDNVELLLETLFAYSVSKQIMSFIISLSLPRKDYGIVWTDFFEF